MAAEFHVAPTVALAGVVSLSLAPSAALALLHLHWNGARNSGYHVQCMSGPCVMYIEFDIPTRSSCGVSLTPRVINLITSTLTSQGA